MNIEEFREFCLQLPGVTECFPFDEETLVFKVMGKMFAMTGLYSGSFTVNLKCEESYALELREKYIEVQPGYHMNKKYWNTVDFEGNLPDEFLKELLKLSYSEVVKKLTKKQKAELQNFDN
ncbi:MAG: MmcQ/YjbR family DNA-binding protein [Flavobacteriaceae bacterium]|jgi:predicted DNA-binding protein (MmcQ/YjbR family)|nr:MmcQ/YjbR family DNA-binding protein [Flavobacteriaceae bacterium]